MTLQNDPSASRRAVLILPEPPYPPDAGNALRDVQQITLLSRLGYEVIVLCARPRRPERAEPGEGKGAHGVRLRFLSETPLLEREGLLTTVARKTSYFVRRRAKHPFGWWLRFYRPEIHLPVALREIDPSLIVVRSLFLDYIALLRRNASCPIVVDCHDDDIHLAAEMVKSVPAWRKIGPLANYVGVRKAVAAALPLADEIWTVSDEDAARLKPFAAGRPIITVPSGVDESRLASRPQPGSDSICAVVANFGYGPNLNGVEWFLSRVWPLIRSRVSAAELWLVGGGGEAGLRALSESNPGVRAIGRVPDLSPVYQEAAVMMVPIIEGGGTRLKVVEAWKNGKAVAGTTKGFEGLSAPVETAVIADDPVRLADRTACLLQDIEARRTLGERGLRFVADHYGWRVIESRLRSSSIVARKE